MVIHTTILVDFTVNMCQVELIYTEIKVYTVEPLKNEKCLLRLFSTCG